MGYLMSPGYVASYSTFTRPLRASTARVSSALASLGIPCNIVAAFHHDHVFVLEGMALHGLEILRSLQWRAMQVDT
jgi:hypothetical protein